MKGKLLREPSKQPDMKALKTDVGQGLRKKAPSFVKQRGWPYSGSVGSDHPSFDKGVRGKQQKPRKWPY
jgi:hypothetical protein